MEIELDVSLENPLDKIDLHSVRKALLDNKKYVVLNFQKNNFISLGVKHYNLRIRIHEDGRFYIKMDIQRMESLDNGNLLKCLLKALNEFLIDTKVSGKYKWKREYNFNFQGSFAYGFFWKNCDGIRKFGEDILNCGTMRLYAREKNAIYVKLAY
jgi:hypothetical protein